MLAYNKGDVLLLEEAYIELLPWIAGHPNLYILGESFERCCKNCGGTEFEGDKPYITPAGEFISMRCTKCGTPMRTRDNLLDKEDKKNLLVTAVR
jgi:RNase P subunit RPR2